MAVDCLSWFVDCAYGSCACVRILKEAVRALGGVYFDATAIVGCFWRVVSVARLYYSARFGVALKVESRWWRH